MSNPASCLLSQLNSAHHCAGQPSLSAWPVWPATRAQRASFNALAVDGLLVEDRGVRVLIGWGRGRRHDPQRPNGQDEGMPSISAGLGPEAVVVVGARVNCGAPPQAQFRLPWWPARLLAPANWAARARHTIIRRQRISLEACLRDVPEVGIDGR